MVVWGGLWESSGSDTCIYEPARQACMGLPNKRHLIVFSREREAMRSLFRSRPQKYGQAIANSEALANATIARPPNKATSFGTHAGLAGPNLARPTLIRIFH